MPTPLGTVIRQARKARKITQAAIAAEFGITKNAVTIWETGDSGPQRDRVPRLAEMLGIDLGSAMRGELVLLDHTGPAIERAEPNARLPDRVEKVDIAKLKGPRDVPMVGVGAGGDKGDFRFNGQVSGYAPRPPSLADRRDVYVVTVVGDSMADRYEHNDPVYVDPRKRPEPRDYVIVELWGDDGEPGDAFVKRLVRRAGGKVVVEQHNPKKEIAFDDADVARLHRIIPWPELLGM